MNQAELKKVVDEVSCIIHDSRNCPNYGFGCDTCMNRPK